MNRFKEQWNNYFEGKISIWSYFGYQYHSNLIVKHVVPKLNIPPEGKIIQLGTGLGIAVETLCNLFGSDRVVGYDLFNPLRHPNIQFLDTEVQIPPRNKIAFIEIDIGSMSHASENRKKLLNWALENTIIGGCILTNKKLADELKKDGVDNFEIIALNSFDIPELWSNVHESRLNTKVILRIIKEREK